MHAGSGGLQSRVCKDAAQVLWRVSCYGGHSTIGQLTACPSQTIRCTTTEQSRWSMTSQDSDPEPMLTTGGVRLPAPSPRRCAALCQQAVTLIVRACASGGTKDLG